MSSSGTPMSKNVSSCLKVILILSLVSSGCQEQTKLYQLMYRVCSEFGTCVRLQLYRHLIVPQMRLIALLLLSLQRELSLADAECSSMTTMNLRITIWLMTKLASVFFTIQSSTPLSLLILNVLRFGTPQTVVFKASSETSPPKISPVFV